MKKYIFIILLFLLAYEAYPQVSLSTRDSVTTFNADDLFWLQRKVTGSYLNRKATWYRLRYNIADYIDGLANTWALGQTFTSRATFNKGATFSAATYGSVTFADSVFINHPAILYLNAAMPQYGAVTGALGSGSSPFYRMYATEFKVINPTGNDSCTISYDDSVLTFSKNISVPNLNITESIAIDSGATFDVFAYTPHSYTIPNVGDTILTLIPTDKYSLIKLDLPGNISPGISQIFVEGAQTGMVLRFFNEDASYTMEFEDYVGSDDNLYMAGDFTSMGLYDFIEFQCVVASPEGATQRWMETGRSNN